MPPVASTTEPASSARPALLGPEGTAGRVRDAAQPLATLASKLTWLLPGLIVVYLAFRTGGYYTETSSVVVVALATILGAHALVSRQPFAGVSAPLAVAAGALLLLVAWTWLSAGWSDSPGRAVLEAQRTSLYLLGLLVCGLFLRRRGGVSLALGGVAVAIVGVCVAALATRLYPDEFTVAETLSSSRLSFPISYWNSLGLFAGLGLVLSLHFACNHHAHALARIAGAAAVPVAASTIYFTFSRGAAAATVAGVVAYLLVARPRGAVAGVLAAGPATWLALRSAYDADLLGTAANTTAPAAAQGHDVAAALLLACGVAAGARALLLVLDARLARIPPAGARLKRAAPVAAAVLLLLAVGGALALDAPDRIERAYESFTQAERGDDARSRFRSVRIGGRADHWRIALDGYASNRLTGTGAGTYELQWLRDRPDASETSEAHSLYIEMLAELGVVGFLLVLVTIGTILGALAFKARGQRRAVYGAVFAVTLTWALHAGVDWDWELPAVTLGVFMLAGVALARAVPGPSAGVARALASWPVRIGVLLVCLVVSVTGVRAVIADAALDDAMRAFDDGDCAAARSDALVATSALGSLARPLEIIGYCELDRGREEAALRAMSEAARLDPGHWRYRYGLAIAQAANGRDPRAELERARELNPQGAILFSGTASALARADGPDGWRQLAPQAGTPRN